MLLTDQRLQQPILPSPEQQLQQPQQVILAEPNDELQVHLAMAQKTVMLQGMIVAPHVPSESKFDLPTPELSDSVFNELKNELEDLMPPIDENWKRFRCLGTSWRAAGSRVGKTVAGEDSERKRTLYVRMFPGSIYHVPSAVRSKVYTEVIPSLCFRIGRGGNDRFHMAVFILPYSNLPQFVSAIEELNNTVIVELNRKIDEFQASSDYKAIMTVLEKYGVASIVENKNFHVPNLSWSWTALSLDTETVKTHVEAAWKQAFGEVDEKKQQMLKDFIEGDMKQREETAKQCLDQLRIRMNETARRIALGSRRNPERLKADLEALRGMAMSMGAEALAESVITPLNTIIDHPEKAIELFGTKEISTEIEGRIRAFIRTF